MVHSRLRLQTSPADYALLLKHTVLGIDDGGSIEKVEQNLKADRGCEFALATNQGRVALYAALKAAVEGERNKIIVSPYTLYEIINMVIYAGGEPVFVDTMANNPFVSVEAIEQLIDDRTAAIMITHYHMPVPDTPKIAELARARNIKLIEDAAVSFGAKLDGKAIGTFGDAGAFSFGLFKIINAFYGGALISTNKEYFAKINEIIAAFPKENRMRLFKRGVYGFIMDMMTHPLPFSMVTYPMLRYALNSNNNFITRFTRADANPTLGNGYPESLQKQPSEMQFELVWRGLAQVEDRRIIREQRAQRYLDAFSGINDIVLPEMSGNAVGSWTEFPIVVSDRDALYRHLMKDGLDVRYYYYRNCADLPIYKPYFRDCPNARNLMKNTLMLPLYPRYPDNEMEKMIASVQSYFSV